MLSTVICWGMSAAARGICGAALIALYLAEPQVPFPKPLKMSETHSPFIRVKHVVSHSGMRKDKSSKLYFTPELQVTHFAISNNYYYKHLYINLQEFQFFYVTIDLNSCSNNICIFFNLASNAHINIFVANTDDHSSDDCWVYFHSQ